MLIILYSAMKKIVQQKTISRLFYSCLFFHLIFWTFAILSVRVAVSHDTIEAFVWAQHLAWGYDKNPWVIGWVARLGLIIGGDVGYYFIQQLCIVSGVWAVWKLGNRFYSPTEAFIASVSLLVCSAFSIYVSINNDNFVLFGFLMLGIYFFYEAVTFQQLKNWLFAGIFLGLALMSKYSAGLFFVFLLVYLLWSEEARQSFKRPGLYLMGAIIFILTLPNLIWLYQHQGVSIAYALARKDQEYMGLSFFDRHFSNPIAFVKNLFGLFLPSLIVILMALPFHRQISLSANTKKFLLSIGLMPLLSLLFLGVFFGWTIFQEWGVPMLGLLPLVMWIYFKPSTTAFAVKRVFFCWIFLVALTFGVAFVVNNITQTGKGSADYPAAQIGHYVTEVWHAKYNTPLRFVAGSRYTAGYAAHASADKPKVFVEWNYSRSPGITPEEIKKFGAIFIQDGYYGTTDYINKPEDYETASKFPNSILKRYPNLIILPIKHFPYHHTGKKIKEYADVLIGILPPGN